MKYKINKKRGFTLLEILLVIAAIGILAAIVLVAINPNRQIAQARNLQRKSDINTIYKALEQYLIDNEDYPIGVDGDFKNICKTNSEESGSTATDCTGKVDLRVLVPDYLEAIPSDPIGGWYKIGVNLANNGISVIASDSELGQNIGINIPTIVKNGLVLNLDAGDKGSYTGTGTTWIDLSGNGNNGTLVNGVNYNSDSLGSLVFDGNNDYVVLTNTLQFNNSDFSISGWFKSNSVSGDDSFRQIWNSGYNGGSSDLEIGLLPSTNTLFFYMRPPDNGVLVETPYSVNDNVWRNFTATKTSSTMSLYVNGSLISSASGFYTDDVDATSIIPRIGNGLNNINNRFFKGNIAQILIYNRAITASEVQQNFNAIRDRFGL